MLSRTQKEKLKSLVPKAAISGYHACRMAFGSIYRQLYSLAYRGSGYYCPFCNYYHRHFLPDGSKAKVIEQYDVIGGGYRPSCLCPKCGSKDRERLLYGFLKQQTNLFSDQPKSVLHIAPEKNLKKVLQKQPQLSYLNADLAAGAADLQMDITQIAYPDNYFDVILCNHVLEHIPNDKKAMQELYRVLKPQGWAILQVPFAEKLSNTYENFSIINPTERETHFGQFDHVRIYGQDYVQRLANVGFNVTTYNALNVLGQDVVNLQQLIANEKVFLCRKEA